MKKNPLVSVVIPVKNGGKTLEKCLLSLTQQTLAQELEIIVIDSGSTDNTSEILKRFPVRVYEIKPEEFGHGKTRNLGVSLAKGQFIVMTVQDAFAISADCIENALKHFEDENVMAVAGKQIVLPDKNKNPLAWYRPQNSPQIKKIKISNINDFDKLTPKKKFEYSYLDDVCAIYRKKALLELPFPDTEYGEDRLWAKEALKKGWTIVIDDNITVSHYHHYTFAQFMKRRFANFELAASFGYYPNDFLSVKKLAKYFYHCFISGMVRERKIHWFVYNTKIWMAYNWSALKFKLQTRNKKNFILGISVIFMFRV